MLIRNLAGVFTGQGFVAQGGRRPVDADCGFLPGPIEIAIDSQSGVICSMGRSLENSQRSEECLDGSGMVALSGFIDSHTHALYAGDRSDEFFRRWAGKSYQEIAQAGGGIHRSIRATESAPAGKLKGDLIERLRCMMQAGTTTVEVKSGYADSAAGELRLLELIQWVISDSRFPRVVPTFMGLHAIPPGSTENDYREEVIEILPKVAEERLARFVDSFPERGFFTVDSAIRFSRAAKARGLGVKVHADEFSDSGTAGVFLREGAVSVDHLQHISPEAIHDLANSMTVATLLPATSFFLGLPYANARLLIDAGAKVALASDYNPGTAPAPELQLTALLAASQLKMTPAEILCGLTFNAACALGLGKDLGALLPGWTADILLFDVSETESHEGIDILRSLIIQRRIPKRVVIGGNLAS